MKVVFLDIDGVLNTDNFINFVILQNTYYNKNIPIIDKFGHLFDPVCVKYLEVLCLKHNAKVVISSTWRYNGLKKMQDMFKFRNIDIDVIDTTVAQATPGFKQQFAELQKLTKVRMSSYVERGYEIQAYLNTHPEIDNYVIFDDDSDMLESQKEHFVLCDQRHGIDIKAYNEADSILSTKFE